MFHLRLKNTDTVLQNQQKQIFLDKYVKGVESGGREAAQRLRDAATDYLRKQIPDLKHDAKIVIRVYGNMKGLSKLYCDADILDQREQFETFAQVFKLHIEDVHCKHIIFGGSADNGYARMLGPYAGNNRVCNRVTMLEGPPFAQELSQLVHKFRQSSFPEVFRDSKIPPRRVSFCTTPPPSITPPLSKSPKPSTWASTIGTASAAPAVELATPEKTRPRQPQGGIPRNSEGQRIDPPLTTSQVLVAKLKARKLCNNHYLGGYCPYPDCIHDHDAKLNDKELTALRYVARMAPCKWGIYCDDTECFSGHQCKPNHCHGANCRFPAEMHKMDTRIASYD
ncbi:MAG: hypothetical protein Q9179_007692 [Wetmoreana sp. 5 TL-2023]